MFERNGNIGYKVMRPDFEIVSFLFCRVECRNVLEAEFAGDVMHTLVAIQYFFHVVRVEVSIPNFLSSFKFLRIVEIRR